MICEPLEHFRYTGKTAWKIDPMSDLVERLRAWHTPGETITGDVQIFHYEEGAMPAAAMVDKYLKWYVDASGRAIRPQATS